MKKSRIFLACVSLLLALTLSACFNVKVEIVVPATNPAPTSPSAPTDAPTEAPAPTEESEAPVPAEEPSAPEEQATASPETPSAPETTAPEPATEVQKTPDQMSNEELLTFFNDSLNRIKTDKVGFRKNKLTSILDLQLSNSAANTLVGIVKNSLLSETGDEASVGKGQDGTGVFSPSGKSYVSTLKPEDLTSISCRKEGESYVISLGVKGETNPGLEGSIMSRGFDFITIQDVVDIYAPKVGATVARENIEVVFSDCTATLTVKADGTVEHYKTYVQGVMNMYDASIKKVITISTDLAVKLASTTEYTDFAY